MTANGTHCLQTHGTNIDNDDNPSPENNPQTGEQNFQEKLVSKSNGIICQRKAPNLQNI